MTRRLSILFGLVTATAVSAFGQFQIGPQLGLDFNDSDFYLGGNAVFILPWQLNDHTLLGNPEVCFYFVDDAPGYSQSYTLIALNALYPLEIDFANAYVGGGLLIDFQNRKVAVGPNQFDFHDTGIGLNAKFGIDFAKDDSNIVPWGEAGLHIKDGSGLWIQGGARFIL